MTITEYIKQLQHIAKKYPDAEVVYVQECEYSDIGERTYHVGYPTIGYLDDRGDFATHANLTGKKIDAVSL
jgi:hypothetical protein